MRVFALRVVLMLTLAILAVSAMSAGLALQAPEAGGDVAYMLVVTSLCSILVAVALLLTRGAADPGASQPPPPELA